MPIADQSVQGAADKILGLLNPQSETPKESKQTEGQSEPEVTAEPSVEPVEEQVTSQESQSLSEEAPAEVEATVNEEVTEETASEVEVEKPNLHRVKVQGQELEVTLDELKAGYSRDSDYRQKTHSLSLEKKQVEEEKSVLRQQYDMKLRELNEAIAGAESITRQQLDPAELQKLYEEDPAQAAKYDFQLRQQQEKINQAKARANQAAQAQYNAYLAEQRRLAQERIPEFADPNKSENFRSGVKSTLKTYGFSDQEISTISDHRMLMVIKDAMSYKGLRNSKPIVQKKVANAPKVIKPGVAKTENSKRTDVRNKISKLKKTGRLDDAQSAILGMLTK
jgi:hypothetical protein